MIVIIIIIIIITIMIIIIIIIIIITIIIIIIIINIMIVIIITINIIIINMIYIIIIIIIIMIITAIIIIINLGTKEIVTHLSLKGAHRLIIKLFLTKLKMQMSKFLWKYVFLRISMLKMEQISHSNKEEMRILMLLLFLIL